MSSRWLGATLVAASVFADPLFDFKDVSAGDHAVVTSFTMPAQKLVGVVNTHLPTATTLSCTDCNTACSVAKHEQGMCNDAPGFSGIAIDPCTFEAVAVTDRGPNQDCSDAAAKGFPLKDFAPAMLRFSLQETKIATDGWVSLKDNALVPVNGLPNKATDDKGLGGQTNHATQSCAGPPFALSPSGLDLEEVQFLSQDTFIGCDEYGPKIVIWSSTGEILTTYVPSNLAGNTYTDANTKSAVKGVLPAIFSARRDNRGMESLAVNPAKTRVAACMQSTMDGGGVTGATANADLRASRVLRCAVIDITDIYNPILITEKVHIQSDAFTTYTAAKRGKASKQKDVKYSGAAWLKDDRVLFLERAKSSGDNVAVVLLEIDFATGTDIKDVAAYNDITLTTGTVKGLAALEGKTIDTTGTAVSVVDPTATLAGLTSAVTPMTSKVSFDFADVPAAAAAKISSKLEGLTIVNSHTILLAEDNDFGYEGNSYSKFHVVQLKTALPYEKSCPAASPLKTFPTGSSGASPKVTSIVFPPQKLMGVVNPHLSKTESDCFDCSQSCATTDKHEQGMCNDAPGFSGIAIDPCTFEAVAVTDRGPNQDCSDAAAKGFPLKEFAPAMVSFKFQTALGNAEKLNIEKWVELKDNSLTPVNGLPNKATDDKALLGQTNGATMTCGAFADFEYKQSGVDLEEVQFLSQDTFIGCDEYGPKIVIWSSTGEILTTYVPSNLAGNTYTDANTKSAVKGVLPAIFSARRDNRGMESLAVNPAKTRVAACMQSTMDGGGVTGATANADLRASRVLRCAVIDITDIYNPILITEKVHIQSDAFTTYTAAKRGKASKQKDVKYSGAAWLKDDRVLFLERAKSSGDNVAVVLLEIDFATGTDIKDVAAYNDITLTTGTVKGLAALEGKTIDTTGTAVSVVDPTATLAGLTSAVTPMTSKVSFDFADVPAAAAAKISSKLEGLTIVNSHTILLAEDNDFGYEGNSYSKFHVVQLPNELPFVKSCPATAPETTTFPFEDVAAETDPVVNTFQFPPQKLAGVVNPDLKNGTAVVCVECDSHCGRTDKHEQGMCNDAPGFSGIAIDPCTFEAVAVTDRGPNQDCSDAAAKGFPLKEFAPAMARFTFGKSGWGNKQNVIVPTGWTPLTANGSTITGLPNKATDDKALLGQTDSDAMTCGAFADFEYKQSGVDLEEVQFLSQDTFIGCDEYGPKIVIWSSTGEILTTYVPSNLAGNTYTDANTKSAVKGVLPAIFSARRDNRGMESLAVNPAKTRVAACMQSTMDGGGVTGATANADLRASRVLRCAVIDITDIYNPILITEKVHIQSDAFTTYTAAKRGKASKQKDVKYSGAAWLKDDRVLFLERAKSSGDNVAVVLLEIDFATGTDIKDVAAYNDITLTTGTVKGLAALEGKTIDTTGTAVSVVDPTATLAGLTSAVTPMTSKVSFDFADVPAAAAAKISSKLEGLTIVNSHTILLAEDNDFGYEGNSYSKFHVVQLKTALPYEKSCPASSLTPAPTVVNTSSPATPTPPVTIQDSDDGLSGGAIAGIVIGSLLGVALLVGIAIGVYFLAGGGAAAAAGNDAGEVKAEMNETPNSPDQV